jgi:hypothetical protein
LGNIVYQLLTDPVRAMSVLASLNSNALDIDQALYLQDKQTEKIEEDLSFDHNSSPDLEVNHEEFVADELEDDLMNFDWDKARQEHAASEDDSEEHVEQDDIEDLLGSFLSKMNK